MMITHDRYGETLAVNSMTSSDPNTDICAVARGWRTERVAGVGRQEDGCVGLGQRGALPLRHPEVIEQALVGHQQRRRQAVGGDHFPAVNQSTGPTIAST